MACFHHTCMHRKANICFILHLHVYHYLAPGSIERVAIWPVTWKKLHVPALKHWFLFYNCIQVSQNSLKTNWDIKCYNLFLLISLMDDFRFLTTGQIASVFFGVHKMLRTSAIFPRIHKPLRTIYNRYSIIYDSIWWVGLWFGLWFGLALGFSVVLNMC